MYIEGLYQRKISGKQVKMMINVDFIELRSSWRGWQPYRQSRGELRSEISHFEPRMIFFSFEL